MWLYSPLVEVTLYIIFHKAHITANTLYDWNFNAKSHLTCYGNSYHIILNVCSVTRSSHRLVRKRALAWYLFLRRFTPREVSRVLSSTIIGMS